MISKEEFRKKLIKNQEAKKVINRFFKERRYPAIDWYEQGIKAFLFGLLDRLTAEGDFEAIDMKKVLKDVIDPWEIYNDREILVSELRNGTADEFLLEKYQTGKYQIKYFQCELCEKIFITKPERYFDKNGEEHLICAECFEDL